MSEIKEKAKELCEKSACHHKCHDTKDCVVEDEAKEVIANSATTTEKQIEEMAITILDFVHTKHNQFSMQDLAEALYNAGYRKQSEGEWIKHCNTYECSVCKEELFIEYAEDYDAIEDWNLHFCPFCGAKMKGGE